MSRKESNNGLQLIKYASISLKGKFSVLFMGTFAMVTPLALCIIIPIIFALLFQQMWILSIGIVLFAIFVGPMQIGYMRFFSETINGEQPKLFRVYSGLKISTHTLRSMYIAVLLLAMYIIGGLLWIVTAGFVVAFLSMSLFFLEKMKLSRMTVAMKTCVRYMIGNRLAMLSYKLVFYFMYFLIFCVGGLCLALVSVVAVDSLIISWIVCVCSVIIFIFMYSFVTLYFHASNEIFYDDLIMYREKVVEKQNNAKLKTAEVKEEKVEIIEEKKETPTKQVSKTKNETTKKVTKKEKVEKKKTD